LSLACAGITKPPAAANGKPDGTPGKTDATPGSWKEKKKATVGQIEIVVEKLVKFRICARQDGRPLTTVDEDWLYVHLNITNLSDTKKVDYAGWCRTPKNASLTDEFGNNYAMKENGPGIVLYLLSAGHPEQVQQADLRPGKTVTDFLVFPLPVDKAKRLTLTLPGDNLGLSEPIVLMFSTSDVVK
jgi:hypothetical protein